MNSPWISLITAKPFLLACCFSLTIKIYHNSSSWQLKSCLLVFLLRVYSFVVLSMFIFGIETEPCWNYSLFILVACNGHLMCPIGSHPSLQVKTKVFILGLLVVDSSMLSHSGNCPWLKRLIHLRILPLSLVQFSSFQSLSHVRLFMTPWTAACQASLTITNSWSLPKLISIDSVMPSNHLILCCPLLLPSIFPSVRVFSNESALHSRWPKMIAISKQEAAIFLT